LQQQDNRVGANVAATARDEDAGTRRHARVLKEARGSIRGGKVLSIRKTAEDRMMTADDV
jgi:hypothetical protein